MAKADMRVFLCHPTGNQNSRQLAVALANQSRLQTFATALACPTWLTKSPLVPPILRRSLSRRAFATPGAMRSVAVLAEASRLAQAAIGLVAQPNAVDSLYRLVDQRAAKHIRHAHPTHVYAYEDGAKACFQAADQINATKVYELPIGHWRAHRALCEAEGHAQPTWAHTWNLADEPAEKLMRKDAELDAADWVVVPSGFVQQTLLTAGVAVSKILVVPYGCPPVAYQQPTDEAANHGPLRILFVGGLSQRKGLSDLVAATSPLGRHVQVTVVGRGPGRALLPDHWHLIDSLAHAEVLAEMRRHDVFLFPTRFEGRSLAVAEALSQGLVLIITPNSGAEDLVEEGVNGWVTPVGDVDAIRTKLDWLLQHRAKLPAMKRESLRLAQKNSWRQYGEAMNQCLAAMGPT